METAPQKITQWSYSRWSCYEDCPAKAKYKFIDRLSEPGSTAMDRGSAIHKMAEEWVAAPKATALPVELKTYADDFKLARRGRPIVEQEWAFTINWEPTGWFAKDCWCRVKTDLVFWRKDELVIVDHKTGKRRDDHLKQLSLYAIGAFLMYDSIDKISSELWYLDQGKPQTFAQYERSELPDMKEAWEQKTKAMLNDTMFAPKPGNSCRWCHFRKENGGPCKF